MIVLVHAGVKQQHGNVVLEEGIMIGVGLQAPRELDPQADAVVVAAQQPPPSAAAPRADHNQVVIAEPPDHVQVQPGRHAIQRDRRMGDPMLRAQQPLLLPVPIGEKDRPLRRLGENRERLCQLEHGGRAAGVVVGAGMNLPVGIEAQAAAAVADVVVMGADHDHLVAQFRIAARQHRQDVAAVRVEGLEEPAAIAAAVQMEPGVLVGEVIAGGMAASRARLAAFHRRVGQLAHLFGPVRRP